jgi:hypothetical protein
MEGPMKSILKICALGSLLAGWSGFCSAARIHVWLGINPFPVVVAPAPVVVAQPVVVPDPYAAPPQDYRVVLDNFHARVRRLQKMLDRQVSRGAISQRQYDRDADDLDQIIKDEQADAARHNGALTPREINELNQRLTELQDRVHEDLAR